MDGVVVRHQELIQLIARFGVLLQSLSVQAGEFISIVGTNGAGKSTLAKCICGFEKVKQGRIFINEADVVVLVVGGSSARDFKTSYEDTGAAIVDDHISDMECGEGYDRCTLDLLGRQNELMEAVYSLGKPVVTVYIEGRPMLKNIAAEKSNALLTLWYPGMEGGSALADILWGEYNPAGRLPISITRNVGQIPVYYSQPNCSDYVESSSKPLYAFGYGLSFTQFEYSDLQIEQHPNNADALFVISCSVKNVGDYNGDEVVQLYVRDEEASLTPLSKLLKGFQRVHINKGETQTVSFVLSESDLSVYSTEKGWHFEPGEFTFMVGASSDDVRLEEKR